MKDDGRSVYLGNRNDEMFLLNLTSWVDAQIDRAVHDAPTFRILRQEVDDLRRVVVALTELVAKKETD